MEITAYNACRADDSVGWPCTDYRVALACGLFGPPDYEHARSALHKGCSLGDYRGCEILDTKLRNAQGLLEGEPVGTVSCELIQPDPKAGIDIPFDRTPVPEGAVLPEGKEPFDRSKSLYPRSMVP